MIYPMPFHMGTHIIPPPPPSPQYISVNQVNQFQQQQQHDENATQISDITAGDSIIGEINDQVSLRSCYNNIRVKNVFCAPDHLTFDGFQSEVVNNTNLFKNLRKNNINRHVSALRHPNKNPREGAII